MVKPWTRAVAAIMATSRRVTERAWIKRAYSRKHAASIGKTCEVSSSFNAHCSISVALLASCTRVNSTPFWISANVTAEKKPWPRVLKVLPFIDRNEDGGIHAAASDDLRALF